MPSTYTLNNGIELISTGEQSGTWGDTTNTNLSLVDAALDGQVTVTLSSAGSSGSPNALPISDGATSNGRNRIVIFNDGSDLGATAYVQLTPNDAEKIIYVRNSLSGSRSIILFQGTYSASNDYEVPAGTTAVVFFDGAGSGAVAANVFNNAYFDSLRLGSVSVTAILDEDNMSSNSATALSTQQSIKAYVDTQVGANNELSEVLANGNTTGSNDIVVNSGQAITTNTVSETTSGSGVTIDSVLLKDDGVNATNLEVTNLKANDGTAAGSIANSTGAFTITSLISNSVDIGGGAIDGTVIGGSTPAAISGTTGSFSGNVSLGDSAELSFGDGNDLILEHNGSNGDIRNITNDLLIRNLADDQDVRIISDDGSGGTADYFRADGSTGEAKMYYYGAEKLNTTSSGVDITGALTLSAADPFIKLTDTSTGVDHEIDANSGVGNMVIHTDINSEGSDPKLLIKVAGTTVLTARDTGDIDVNGVDIGLGGSGESSNTALGKQALEDNTTGTNNVAVGYQALPNNTTGYSSVAVGQQALLFQTTGSRNTAIGRQALRDTTTGGTNTAVGQQSLRLNTTGSSNTATGHESLWDNTTGISNVANGYRALYNNTTASSNVAVGANALYSNTEGGTNIALGREALYSNTTASNNVATGYRALYDNTTGASNVATGREALFNNTTANNNTAVGLQTLYTNTTGSSNSAYGGQALFDNTTGANNTALGYRALYENTTASANTAVGREALYSNTTGYSNTANGYQSLLNNITGAQNVAGGLQALYNNTTGVNSSATGFRALYLNTTGGNNVANGYHALYNNTTGGNNVAVGFDALYSNTTANGNSATGFQALRTNTTGSFNTATGRYALLYNTTGGNNTATGINALLYNTTGGVNSAYGYLALGENTTGGNNVALGAQALGNNTTGSGNFGAAFRTSGSVYSPVFDPTTESNRVVMGHTAVTNAYVQVAWTVVSDERDKTQIEPMQHGLDFVDQLNPVSYKFRKDRDTEETNGKKRYGFLAQDVLAIEGEDNVIVDNEDPDKLRMTHEELIPILVNAIKELKAEVETLKGQRT